MEENVEHRQLNTINDSNWYSEMCCLFYFVILAFFLEFFCNSIYFNTSFSITYISYCLFIISIFIKISCLYKIGFYIYLFAEIIYILRDFVNVLIPAFNGESIKTFDQKDNMLIKENEIVKNIVIFSILVVHVMQIYLICYFYQKINIFIAYEKYKRSLNN